jgi:hypothetical protein
MPHDKGSGLQWENQAHDSEPDFNVRSCQFVITLWRDWLDACKGGTPANAIFQWRAALTEVSLLGQVAQRVGKKIQSEVKAMKATDAPAAAESEVAMLSQAGDALALLPCCSGDGMGAIPCAPLVHPLCIWIGNVDALGAMARC